MLGCAGSDGSYLRGRSWAVKSRSRTVFDKSLAAMLAAIEIYNKPDFPYREETFAVLAINAWELLLKARILQLDRNRIGAILEFERRRKADGTMSDKLYRKKNRSGNQLSIGLFRAVDTLVNQYGDTVDPLVRTNIELLTEIRDNSIHFFNKDFELSKRVLEIGTASVRNYVTLSRKWFGADLSGYNMFIMPMAFAGNLPLAEVIPLNGQERQLLDYIRAARSETTEDPASDYSVALEVDVRFKRTSGESFADVRVTRDPDAAPVRLEEEDILERYPWDYQILTTRLSKRYSDFLQNSDYHDLRRALESEGAYCRERLLDPGKPRGLKKRFYSPNIVRGFDRHYTRKA